MGYPIRSRGLRFGACEAVGIAAAKLLSHVNRRGLGPDRVEQIFEIHLRRNRNAFGRVHRPWTRYTVLSLRERRPPGVDKLTLQEIAEALLKHNGEWPIEDDWWPNVLGDPVMTQKVWEEWRRAPKLRFKKTG
jgi:hypothetical protein